MMDMSCKEDGSSKLEVGRPKSEVRRRKMKNFFAVFESKILEIKSIFKIYVHF